MRHGGLHQHLVAEQGGIEVVDRDGEIGARPHQRPGLLGVVDPLTDQRRSARCMWKVWPPVGQDRLFQYHAGGQPIRLHRVTPRIK